MPTMAQIALKDADALTPLERERVREILNFAGHGGEFAELNTLCDGLTGPQNQAVRAWLDVWDDAGDDTVRVQGGRDGVDSDDERNRELVRRRLRLLFGLPEISGVGTLDRSQLIGAYRIKRRNFRGSSEL